MWKHIALLHKEDRMSLPTWNEYKEGDNLPQWNDYSPSNSLPQWDDYNAGSNYTSHPVDLDAIEQIESNGKNNAVSRTGAKGLYQFEPDTAEEYSKRLFGVGTRDASALSPEQQKQMSNAMFNDLMKHYNNDTTKAVAAYNWGEGNVDKAINKYGDDWLEHAPKETRNYVHKYEGLVGDNYDHATSADMTQGEWWSNQWEQIKDLDKGAAQLVNKWTGNKYNQSDIDEAARALGSREGKALKTTAAVGASVVAPELIPEMAGAGEAGVILKGANWLAKGLAGSEAYQLVDTGTLSAKQTAIDLGTGAAFEGALRGVASPAIKQVSKAFNKFIESKAANPELTNTVKSYLGAARAEELGKNWIELKEVNPNATLLDAYNTMGEQVPEVFKSGAIEDVKASARKYKNTGSPTAFTSDMKAIKQRLYSQAKELAKSDADKRLINTIADADKTLRLGADIPEHVLESTPLQKAGTKLGDWFGVDMPKSIKAGIAANDLKPEADALIKDLRADNRRIAREMKAQGKRPEGASTRAKMGALRRQNTLNNKMIQFLNDGMKGNKVKVADIAQAIKEVQEEQFNTGKFKGLTQRFKTLSDKFEAGQVHKLQAETGILSQAADHLSRKAGHHLLTKTLGVGVAPLAIGSTIAARMAKASKASNLAYARILSDAVESGELTEEQAEKALVDKLTGKAQVAGRLAPSISEQWDSSK